MPRIRAAIVLSALASIALAGTALAAKVTGGTTTIAPSSAALTLLANNHITVTPVAPATASSAGALTFPIAGGRLNTKTLHGVIRQTGGFQLSNGTKTVTVRGLRVVSDKAGASVWAIVRDHASRFCTHLRRLRARIICRIVTRVHVARIATISGGSVSGSTFTGNVAITKATATLIDKLAGSAVVSGGAPLGTVTITPTLS